MDKLYAFEVKRASEEDIPAIIKITKDAFLNGRSELRYRGS